MYTLLIKFNDSAQVSVYPTHMILDKKGNIQRIPGTVQDLEMGLENVLEDIGK